MKGWDVSEDRERIRAFRAELAAFGRDAKRILPYFDPYRRKWMFLFAVANLYTLLALIDPLLMKFVIDEVLVQGKLALLHFAMGVFIVISVGSLALNYYSSVLYEDIAQHLLFDIRTEMYDHLQHLDILYFEEHKLGDLLSRLHTDIASIETFLSLVYDDLLINVLKVLVTFSIVAVLSWEFAALTLVMIPIMVIIQKHYGHLLRTQYRTIRTAAGDLMSFFQERLSSIRLVKSFGREEQEAKLQRSKGAHIVDLNVSYVSTRQVAAATTGFVTFSVMLFVLWYGGFKVITGALTLGSLIAIYTYISRLFGPVRTLTDLNISFQTTIASARRVFAVLDAESIVAEQEDAETLPPIDGDITFDDVSFAYDETPVFEDVDLHIEPGETVGIVGPTGTGKTTLARLVMRFIDPDTGTVSIDGHDLTAVTLDSLRSQIGLVAQDLLFFHTTIRENLAYADPDAADADLVDAAERAGIHDFIANLPAGYDTDIGERGAELSRGERQRLAMARVFLKEPPIVILDEATASLDPRSEEHVQESLQELAADTTMIIIAHHLETMRFVDRLIVLEGTGIAETGTFEELKENNGPFQDLYAATLDDR